MIENVAGISTAADARLKDAAISEEVQSPGAAAKAADKDKMNLKFKDFLNLTIQQILHQNPMEPMGVKEMAEQFATLSSIQNTSSLNDALRSLAKDFRGTQENFKEIAASMGSMTATNTFLGKKVSIQESPEQEAVSGKVDAIIGTGENLRLIVNRKEYSPDKVTKISS